MEAAGAGVREDPNACAVDMRGGDELGDAGPHVSMLQAITVLRPGFARLDERMLGEGGGLEREGVMRVDLEPSHDLLAQLHCVAQLERVEEA